MSLLDYFLGYHQINMKEEDKSKVSFITPSDIYFFVRMPEGLKNTGSTFFLADKVYYEKPCRAQHFHLSRRHYRR